MKEYADRAFVTINGIAAADVQTANVARTQNLTRVETMTRNKRSAGFKKGNLGVTGSLEVAIKKLQAAIDLAIIDPSVEVNLIFEVGGDRYTVKDLAESDMTLTGSVGDASKSINFEAIDIINENGNSVNSIISLG